MELLYDLLTKEQKKTFLKKFSFDVVGSEGGKYTVLWGCSVNVKGADNRFCLAPRDCHDIAMSDTMIAQKLLIETDEPKFLASAVKWPMTRRF